nr:hypothetical protein [Tanacetum cinerariifolium]
LPVGGLLWGCGGGGSGSRGKVVEWTGEEGNGGKYAGGKRCY